MSSACGGLRDWGRRVTVMCHAEAFTLNTQKCRVFMTTVKLYLEMMLHVYGWFSFKLLHAVTEFSRNSHQRLKNVGCRPAYPRMSLLSNALSHKIHKISNESLLSNLWPDYIMSSNNVSRFILIIYHNVIYVHYSETTFVYCRSAFFYHHKVYICFEVGNLGLL